MDRRTVLKGITAAGTLAATGKLAAPAVAQGAKVLKFVPQANLANFDPIWGTQYVVRNASAAGLGHALRRRRASSQPQRQMVESEEVSSRRPDLDLQAARRSQVPRRRAGARQGRGREPHALDGPRLHGPDAQGDPEGAHRGRRPHLQVGAVQALSQDAVGARQEQHADAASSCRSGSPRPIRSSRSTEYIGSRPDEVRARRMGAGRQGGVREVRRLRAAQRAGHLAGRRQDDAASTASSGSSCPTPPPPRPRCRTARSTGGRRRSPISCRCSRRTATSRSTSPIRSATSAPSA